MLMSEGDPPSPALQSLRTKLFNPPRRDKLARLPNGNRASLVFGLVKGIGDLLALPILPKLFRCPVRRTRSDQSPPLSSGKMSR